MLIIIICRELLGRKKLDAYLSSALGVPLKNGRLQDIDDENYVLTVDYAIKVHKYCMMIYIIIKIRGVVNFLDFNDLASLDIKYS